jgi:hypothetical protein
MATDEFEIPRTAADRSVTDLLPRELVQLGKDASTAIQVFSSAKSAVEVTVAILKVLGVLLLFALN